MINEESKAILENKGKYLVCMAWSQADKWNFEHIVFLLGYCVEHYERYQKTGDVTQRDYSMYTLGRAKERIEQLARLKLANGDHATKVFNGFVRMYNYVLVMIDLKKKGLYRMYPEHKEPDRIWIDIRQ